MDKKFINSISQAWQEVYEKKTLDPVNDKENDKKFKNRTDKDIDNDGDVDSSDQYLHKRRKATDDAIDGGKKPAKNEEVDESSCGSVNASKKKMKEDDDEMETDEPMAKDGMKKCKECGGSSDNHDEECSKYTSSEKAKASVTKEAVRHEVHGYGEIITETDNGYDILFAHGVEFDVPAEQCESIRRAMDIAKKSGGAMTPAVKKMDKIKKGVSDNPRVSKALQKANEEDELEEKLEKERVKLPNRQRPKGPGWVLKKSGEQSGKDHSEWERKVKRVESVKEDDVDEARNGGDDDPCWDTHKKVGTKMKGGKRVNDCVPKNESVTEGTVAEVELDVHETYSAIQQQTIQAMRSMWEGAGAVANKKAKPDPKGQPADANDDNLKGKGAVDMAKDIDAEGADSPKVPKGGDDAQGHEDATKAGRVVSQAPARSGDQKTGDKKIVNPVKGATLHTTGKE